MAVRYIAHVAGRGRQPPRQSPRPPSDMRRAEDIYYGYKREMVEILAALPPLVLSRETASWKELPR